GYGALASKLQWTSRGPARRPGRGGGARDPGASPWTRARMTTEREAAPATAFDPSRADEAHAGHLAPRGGGGAGEPVGHLAPRAVAGAGEPVGHPAGGTVEFGVPGVLRVRASGADASDLAAIGRDLGPSRAVARGAAELSVRFV